MKKRGLSSPDNADALALTFAYPVADMPDHLPAMRGYGRRRGGREGQGNHRSEYDPFEEL